MFTNLRKAAIAEIEKRYAITPADFTAQGEEKEPRAYRLIGRAWNAKPYAGTPEQVKAKICAALDRKKKARIAEQIAQIDKIAAAPDKLPSTLIIRLEAHKGYMGWQWKGSDNYGHEGRFTGGYGYDKHSTALAEILNFHDAILKKMYAAKDKAAKKSNNDALGYGAGYGVLPYFEGGVGSGCHVSILRGLGYEVTEGNDVYVITEK